MNQQQEKNWWSRNWKWFVPVGCLGSFALLAGSIVLILSFVVGMMKSSDAYKNGLAIAKAHPSVQKTIGTPIEDGTFVTGNINLSGSSGEADLSVPISGPDGKATLYIVAEKSTGQWTFSTLVVEVEATNQRIDLLE